MGRKIRAEGVYACAAAWNGITYSAAPDRKSGAFSHFGGCIEASGYTGTGPASDAGLPGEAGGCDTGGRTQKTFRTEGYMSGLSETEESKEKGNDFAEVSDIREYMPGDRIRDIHWKLSAKKDILMVKERVSVAGSEMMVLLQPGGEKTLAEQVLIQAFILSQAFLEQQIPVCLLLWDQRRYGWEENRSASQEELEEVFAGYIMYQCHCEIMMSGSCI